MAKQDMRLRFWKARLEMGRSSEGRQMDMGTSEDEVAYIDEQDVDDVTSGLAQLEAARTGREERRIMRRLRGLMRRDS